MPLDSNSRFIAGVCGVAVALLLAWLHGTGKGVDQGLSRCEPDVRRADEALDCASCHPAATSRNAATVTGGARPPPAHPVSSAPRA